RPTRGPLAPTAGACGPVLAAIAGADPADPTTAARPYRYDARDPGRGFRFALVGGTAAAAEPAVGEAFTRALGTLREIGSVEEIALPALPYEAMTRVILWSEAASAFEVEIESGAIAGLTAPEDRVTPYARDAILSKDYLRALRLRGVVARDIDGVLSRFDAIVGPSRGNAGPRLGAEFRSPIGGGAPHELETFTPSNFVFGRARVDGRPVVVGGDDFTVRGGSADATIKEKHLQCETIAHELRLPLIRLVEGSGGGGSVKTIETTGRANVP